MESDCREGRDEIMRFLASVFDTDQERKVSLIVEPPLEGTRATPTAVLSHYNSLAPDPSECWVFYYDGHGARDTYDHFLDVSHNDLTTRFYRSYVRNAMMQKQPGFGVILTNSSRRLKPPALAAAAPWPLRRDAILTSQGTFCCSTEAWSTSTAARRTRSARARSFPQ